MKKEFLTWKDGFGLSDDDMEQLALNIKVGEYECTQKEYDRIQQEAKERGLV